jgi:hypothetical protein
MPITRASFKAQPNIRKHAFRIPIWACISRMLGEFRMLTNTSRSISSARLTLLILSLTAFSCAAAGAEDASYTSSVTHDTDHNTYMVSVTSTSTTRLICTIHYTATTYLNRTQDDRAYLFLAAHSSSEESVTASKVFRGYREFAATVSCTAPRTGVAQ